MQLVLVKSGFLHEGRLRKAWSSESGERMDTMVYGILREDISHTS
jgi:RimJ/RimL family protein N-acetyltransferase